MRPYLKTRRMNEHRLQLEDIMIALPYDYFLIAWFVIAAASTAYVAFDQFSDCHPHHTTNNNVEQKETGGLTLVLNVQ